MTKMDDMAHCGPIQTTRQATVADSQPWLEKVAHGLASRIFKITYRKRKLMDLFAT